MDCPKCPGKLEDHTIEGLDVYCCFVCEGLWFDAGELEEVIKRDAHDFDFIDLGQEEYDGAEEKKTGIDLNKKLGKCPVCKTVMAQKPYEKKHSVIIDSVLRDTEFGSTVARFSNFDIAALWSSMIT